MATLAEALRAGELGSAYCDTPEGGRITVRAELAGHKPGSPGVFVATIQRGVGMPEEVGRTTDLAQVEASLRSPRLAPFDSSRASWQPASAASESRSAIWSDEASTRNLPDSQPALETRPAPRPEKPRDEWFDPLA